MVVHYSLPGQSKSVKFKGGVSGSFVSLGAAKRPDHFRSPVSGTFGPSVSRHPWTVTDSHEGHTVR